MVARLALSGRLTSLGGLEATVRGDLVTAIDNSCLLHLAGGMHRVGLQGNGKEGSARGSVGVGEIRLMHLAEILASRREGEG